MLHGSTNSFGTRKNWEKLALYPEHKNKNKEFIVKSDMKFNFIFINQVEKFDKDVKKWSEEQIWINDHRTKNKARTTKSLHKLNQILDNKRIMQNYTLTENAIFLRNNFGENKNKINEFFEIALESWLKSANIPKEQVISAIIHYDQSTPHLHIAISSFYQRYNKEFKKSFITSNSKIFNIYHNLSQKLILNRNSKDRIQKLKEYLKPDDIETFIVQETKEFGILGETMDFIEEKYKLLGENIYLNDRSIKISKIRGFENDFLVNQNESIAYKIFKNNIIFKYRIAEAKLKFEKFKTTDDSKNLHTYAFMRMKMNKNIIQIEKEKEWFSKNPNQDLFLLNHEKNMLAKLNYYKRIEIDLASIGVLKILNELKFNNIQKNRFYNDVLYFCNEKRILNNIDSYTPQDFSKEVYDGTYKLQDIKNLRAIEVENALLKKIDLELLRNNHFFDKTLKELDFNSWLNQKNEIVENVSINVLKSINELNLWFNADDIDVKTNLANLKLGINTENIENILLKAEAIKIKKEIDRFSDLSKNNDQVFIKNNKPINWTDKNSHKKVKMKLVFSNFQDLNNSAKSIIELNRIIFLTELCLNDEKFDEISKYYGYDPKYIEYLSFNKQELDISISDSFFK